VRQEIRLGPDGRLFNTAETSSRVASPLDLLFDLVMAAAFRKLGELFADGTALMSAAILALSPSERRCSRVAAEEDVWTTFPIYLLVLMNVYQCWYALTIACNGFGTTGFIINRSAQHNETWAFFSHDPLTPGFCARVTA
jgi:low temperature requirement protein LtrA